MDDREQMLGSLERIIGLAKYNYWHRGAGYRNSLWQLIGLLEYYLKDLEAMRDDAEASHDYAE